MTKPEEACGSTGPSMTKEGNNTSKKNSHCNGLNPQNMFLATKYHNNMPDTVVILHFDDLLMRELFSRKKTK
ncbi:uncharacterized protein LOC118071476 [Chelonus insularis]|uniref:uncharacterized protein LOC118071476 n=1 Tax=Chelonus insularis TaxID=460826 RepID=UPI0020C95FF0|nr:uncharacterized protein LOC118071476 [Chelonus insularis]KAG8148314.1 CiV14g2-like-1 protein [Chelonus insularis]